MGILLRDEQLAIRVKRTRPSAALLDSPDAHRDAIARTIIDEVAA